MGYLHLFLCLPTCQLRVCVCVSGAGSVHKGHSEITLTHGGGDLHWEDWYSQYSPHPVIFTFEETSEGGLQDHFQPQVGQSLD